MNQTTPILDAQGLSKSFQRGPETVRALDKVSLQVHPGEIVAIAGPSGSGKSTLLDILLDWQQPDEGHVSIHEGDDTFSLGVSPQHLGLFDELTAHENVQLPQRIGRHAVPVEDLLRDLDIGELATRLPRELSLGQQQRVAIARAVASSPTLVIVDEPTSHQDAERTNLVMAMLRNVADSGGGVLMTSHDPRVIDQCDHVLQLVDGHLATSNAIDTGPDDQRPLSIVEPAIRATSTPRVARRVALALFATLAAVVALVLLTRTTDLPTSEPQVVSSAVTQTPDDFGTIEEIQVDSAALGQSQRTVVFLPPGYSEGVEPLPTIYLFHGQGETPEMFQRLGFFHRYVNLLQQGRVVPSIIVAPSIDNSFGVSNPETESVDVPGTGRVVYNGGDYEEFLASDLIAAIDTRYRTSPDPSDRSVGGISMGGFAALHLGLRHPEEFGRVGAHSPALIGTEFTWLYPDPQVQAMRDPLLLASDITASDLAGTRFYLDVGIQDEFDIVGPVQELVLELQAKAEVTGVVRDGNHSDEYWRPRVDEYLLFYAEADA